MTDNQNIKHTLQANGKNVCQSQGGKTEKKKKILTATVTVQYFFLKKFWMPTDMEDKGSFVETLIFVPEFWKHMHITYINFINLNI